MGSSTIKGVASSARRRADIKATALRNPQCYSKPFAKILSRKFTVTLQSLVIGSLVQVLPAEFATVHVSPVTTAAYPASGTIVKLAVALSLTTCVGGMMVPCADPVAVTVCCSKLIVSVAVGAAL